MSSRSETVQSLLISVCVPILTIAVIAQIFFLDRPSAVESFEPRLISEWQSVVDQSIPQSNLSAEVLLVEFVDLQCPFCRDFHQRVVAEVRKDYGPALGISFVHFPLAMHPSARPAAEAAECAGQQGRFAEFVDAVFSSQDSLGIKSWERYAEDAAIPQLERFSQCLDNRAPDLQSRIEGGMSLGEKIGVVGTPTILVNGWLLPTPPGLDELRRIVEALLEGQKPFG